MSQLKLIARSQWLCNTRVSARCLCSSLAAAAEDPLFVAARERSLLRIYLLAASASNNCCRCRFCRTPVWSRSRGRSKPVGELSPFSIYLLAAGCWLQPADLPHTQRSHTQTAETIYQIDMRRLMPSEPTLARSNGLPLAKFFPPIKLGSDGLAEMYVIVTLVPWAASPRSQLFQPLGQLDATCLATLFREQLREQLCVDICASCLFASLRPAANFPQLLSDLLVAQLPSHLRRSLCAVVNRTNTDHDRHLSIVDSRLSTTLNSQLSLEVFSETGKTVIRTPSEPCAGSNNSRLPDNCCDYTSSPVSHFLLRLLLVRSIEIRRRHLSNPIEY